MDAEQALLNLHNAALNYGDVVKNSCSGCENGRK